MLLWIASQLSFSTSQASATHPLDFRCISRPELAGQSMVTLMLFLCLSFVGGVGQNFNNTTTQLWQNFAKTSRSHQTQLHRQRHCWLLVCSEFHFGMNCVHEKVISVCVSAVVGCQSSVVGCWSSISSFVNFFPTIHRCRHWRRRWRRPIVDVDVDVEFAATTAAAECFSEVSGGGGGVGHRRRKRGQ